MQTIISGDVRPRSGDLVLARVDEIGKQRRIERPDGRKALLLVGDEILVCYGNRYAPDQFEALIGDDLGPCDLVAAGGLAAHELTRHEKMIEPTRISPIGLVGDAAGKPLNLEIYAIPETMNPRPIKSVLVVGTSMNAGKTFSSASLVRGLKATGRRVAAIKVTGTGSGGDLWIMHDVGADVVLDFTDAGYASTYKTPVEDLEKASIRLMEHAARLGCDYAVIEIADGLGQAETLGLLRSTVLRRRVSGVVFAAGDALGAKSGTEALEKLGHRVLAISGLLTRSPLALRETMQMTKHMVYKPSDLQIGALAEQIIGEADQPTHDCRRSKAFDDFKQVTDSVEGVNGHRFDGNVANNNRVKGKRLNGNINGEHKLSGLTSGHRAFRLKQKMQVGGMIADSGVLMRFLKFVANRLMEIEANRLCGAEQGTRCRCRVNYRNGYKEIHWNTVVGSIALQVPKLKKGNYLPSFMKRYAWADNSLIAALAEYWDHGNTVYWRDRFARATARTGISLTSSELNELRTEICQWVQFTKLQLYTKVDSGETLLLIPAEAVSARLETDDCELEHPEESNDNSVRPLVRYEEAAIEMSFDAHQYDKIES